MTSFVTNPNSHQNIWLALQTPLRLESAEHLHGLVEEAEGRPEVTSPHHLRPPLTQSLVVILNVEGICSESAAMYCEILCLGILGKLQPPGFDSLYILFDVFFPEHHSNIPRVVDETLLILCQFYKGNFRKP